MSGEFNPYAEWFRVDQSNRSPNNYALLGLRLFETNESTIQLAAEERLRILAGQSTGSNSHLARRLRFEVESARDCLLNTELKAAYDGTLKARQAPQDTSLSGNQSRQVVAKPAGATAAHHRNPPVRRREQSAPRPTNPELSLPVPAADADLPAIDFLNFEQGCPRKRRKKKTAADQGIGIVLALIPTVVTAGLLYWKFGPAADPQPTQNNPSRAASIFDYSEPVADRTPVQRARRPASPPRRLVEVDRNRAAPILVDPGKESPELDIPAARPNRQVFRPINVPKHVELPPMESSARNEFQLLFPLDCPAASSCQLAVLNPSQAILGTPGVFEAKPADSEQDAIQRRWLVNLVERASALTSAVRRSILIAEFGIEQQGFRFRWRDEGRSPTAQSLRNCVLMLTVDGRELKVAMRQPTSIPAEPIDLEKSTSVVRLPGEWAPEVSALTLEFIGVSGFDGRADIPAESIRGTSDDVRVVFKNDSPRVEARIGLTAASGLPRLKAETVIVDRDGDVVPLTLDRIATMSRTLPASMRSAEHSLSKNLSRLSALRSDYQQVFSSSNAQLGGRRALMLSALEKDIQKTQVAAGRAQKQIQQASARISVLPDIDSVARQIHGRATLKYRVYFPVANEQVEILRVE